MNALAQPRLRVPGFRFAETMSGFAFVGGRRRAMSFRVRAEAEDLREHLRTGRTLILGTVDIEGLCDAAPLHGVLFIQLPRRIRYEFSFRAGDGRALRFVGQKDLSLLRPLRTPTTLPGELREGDEVLGLCRLRFPLRTLPAFLGSFRPLF